MMNKLLTRKEVMEKLGVKSSHFSKLCNGKVMGVPQLTAVRFGRLLRFRAEQVEAWITEVESTCKTDR